MSAGLSLFLIVGGLFVVALVWVVVIRSGRRSLVVWRRVPDSRLVHAIRRVELRAGVPVPDSVGFCGAWPVAGLGREAGRRAVSGVCACGGGVGARGDLSRVPGAVDLGSAAPGALPDNGFEYRESGMGARVRKDVARVYANVCVHADVEIALAMDRDEGEGAAIHIGLDGPDLILDFADVESMDRLAEVAADGARQMRERIAATARAADARRADRLVGAGVAR